MMFFSLLKASIDVQVLDVFTMPCQKYFPHSIFQLEDVPRIYMIPL